MPASSRTAAGARRCYRALYDYVAQNHDELSLKTGDVLTISAKQEHGQGDAWLHGSLPDGRTGIFPANYVQPVTYM